MYRAIPNIPTHSTLRYTYILPRPVLYQTGMYRSVRYCKPFKTCLFKTFRQENIKAYSKLWWKQKEQHRLLLQGSLGTLGQTFSTLRPLVYLYRYQYKFWKAYIWSVKVITYKVSGKYISFIYETTVLTSKYPTYQYHIQWF